MALARHTGYSRLLSKTNCPVKLLYVLLLGNADIHRWSEYFQCWRECHSFSGNKRHTVPQEPWAPT